METDDWNNIAPAGDPHSDNVRRADPTHPLDFFRGRDFAGRYLLSLTAAANCQTLPGAPKLNGIEVRVERHPPAGARLVLTLEDPGQFDIFRALCGHLLRATSDQPKGGNALGLRLVLRRLRDWHDLLRRRRDSLLSGPEAIGLAGELLFLRDQILPRMPTTEAALAWRGAHREEQDFALGHWQIEVKTQLSTSDQRLLIASEAQLDTPSGQLLLCHQCLAAAPATAIGAFNLNSLAAEIGRRLADIGDLAERTLETALEAWGYTRHPDYDETSWVMTHRQLFEVTGGFPRIVPSMLPSGVRRVSYEVSLNECEPFAIDVEAAMRRVFG